jgi:NitT/TauT family transport system substrate-binding protein
MATEERTFMPRVQAALLGCALFALAIAVQRPLAGGAQAPLTTVRVAGVLSDELTPVLYAQKSGMYAKAGLDVQIVPAASGAAVTTAVLAGSIEIGKSSLISLMNAHLRGVPLAIIGGSGVYDPKFPYAQMVTAVDSPIASAKDLIGKTIGVPSLNDLNVLAADLWLDKNGGDSKTVKFVEVPNSTLGAALTEKRADAAVMTYPYLADVLESHAVKPIGAAYGAISNSFLITAWFVSTDWAAKHPDVIKTFIDVTDRSAAYTNAHHAETAPLISDITKIPLAVIAKMPRSESSTVLHLSDIQPLIDGSAKYKLIPQAFPARDLLWSGISAR